MSVTENSTLICAGIIANLEGISSIPLPEQPESKPTLVLLERRARVLEARKNIIPPPPVAETNWESLAWRVCRLSRRSYLAAPLQQSRNVQALFTALVPDASDVSLEKLRDLVDNVPSREPKPSWLHGKMVDEEEDEIIYLLFQHLCHVRGQRSNVLDIGRLKDLKDLDRAQIYATAVNICLDDEQNHSPYMPSLPGLGGRPTWGQPPRHGMAPSPRPGPHIPSPPIIARTSSFSSGYYSDGGRRNESHAKNASLLTKIRNSGWLRMMFCLKPKKSIELFDDDSSSITRCIVD